METVGQQSVLVVVSHDFGELAYAYDFVQSLQEKYAICIALPEHIYQSNRGVLKFKCVQYKSDDDILSLYQKLAPEYVLLFSAFLLVPNKVFSVRSLGKFVACLKRDRKVLMSSDPFLGMTGSFSVGDVNLEWVNPSTNRLRQYLLSWLTCLQFRRIHAILDKIPRLLPFGVNGLDMGPEPPEGYYSYFNTDLKPTSPETVKNSYWLFVISELDYSLQKKNIGEDKYVEHLLNKLVETSGLGKTPVLMAPLELIEKVQKRQLPVECHNQRNVIEHRNLILKAERVFYWNMISHSIYHRLTRHKPLHFFDRGHVYEMFPRLHRRAMRSYYQGEEPALVDCDEPLSIDMLTHDSEKFYSTRLKGLEILRELPNSDVLLQELAGSLRTQI
ncbi:MAG: hypothetical protein COB20_09460 [SAR86 cluster bacterium]|uniref:Uncharacterized protein n=1 Tax=SAR86 cluster bacterium TaxID=2030880 RepID=A0A2A4X2Y2_9GAMM|nr:MAG: hypothetical protein COB20_09460 [SAR86 cluster bacterium]